MNNPFTASTAGGLSPFQQMSGLGGLIGGAIGQGLTWSNPADAANPYLSQISGQVTPYFTPYIQAGQSALPQLQQQYGNLMQNPTGFMKQIGSQYQPSPGYQWQVDQATKAANQSAAAGGMVGSPAEQQALAGTVTGLANQDYYNWLNQAMGIYGQGLQGMGNIANMGYGAGRDLSQVLADQLMSQAQLEYASQINKNQMQGGTAGGIGGLIGGIGSLVSSFF